MAARVVQNSKPNKIKRKRMNHQQKLTTAAVTSLLAFALLLLAGVTDVNARSHHGRGGHHYRYNVIQAPGSAVITAINLGANTITLGDRQNQSGRRSYERSGTGTFGNLTSNPASMAGIYRVDAFTKVILGSGEELGENAGLSALQVGQVVAVTTFGNNHIIKIQILGTSGGNSKGTGKHGKHGKPGKHHKRRHR
jgi:hypothetical protein